MNIERFVNSKFYRGFEWFIRLLFLNLLIIFITVIIGGGPLIYWYFHQDSSVLLIFSSIILIPFAFIPCYVTSFYIIKYYKEDNSGFIFKLFFLFLWNSIKKLYILELIIVPIFVLLLYSGYYYWQILDPEYFQMNIYGVLSIIGFGVVFFITMAIIFAFLHLPMIYSYFRMTTMGYLKLSFLMAFKYIFKTLLSILLFTIPIFLTFFFQSELLHLLFLLYGISLPQYLMYLSTRDIYWYLQNNIDDINNSDKF